MIDKPWLEPISTPYKHPELALRPSYRPGSFDSHAVDCPFLFSFAGRVGMTFVGWDSIGYRTGLAFSTDMVHWRKEGILLDRGPQGSPTEFNAAMTCILRDNQLFGPGALKAVDGQFVGAYHAYPRPGYESGPASIGLCFSRDLYHWEIGDPILHPDPRCAWEAGGLYKAWLMEYEGTFYLFYNAKNNPEWPWIEQTGVATSTDLLRWERCPENPVLRIGPPGAFDDLFASDPCVLHTPDGWVMFYFGNSSDGHARDGAAFSTDLLHWEKASKVLLDVGSPGSIDSRHAHKPSMIFYGGMLYHFYCAVAPAEPGQTGMVEQTEVRGITFAASQKES
jgi:predicted GH43/DUF377 family glycosyl hydrolase